MRDRDILIIIGAVVAFFAFGMPTMGIFGVGMMRHDWGPWDGSFHWWGGLMMGLWFLIVVGAVVLLLALFRSGAGRDEPRDGGTSRPMEILRERYARGEIDEEEFEQKRRVLES